MSDNTIQPAEIADAMNLPNISRIPAGPTRDYVVALHTALQRFSTHVARAIGILNSGRLVVGLLADRPAATGSRVLYIATDAKSMAIDVAGGWIEL